MALYEVEYSYTDTVYELITVEADSLDGAEEAAQKQLDDILDPSIRDVTFVTITELKQ